jgi:hypothetical protein
MDDRSLQNWQQLKQELENKGNRKTTNCEIYLMRELISKSNGACTPVQIDEIWVNSAAKAKRAASRRQKNPDSILELIDEVGTIYFKINGKWIFI